MFRLHRKESLQNLKLNRVETNCQRMNLSGYPQKCMRRPPLTVLEQANARASSDHIPIAQISPNANCLARLIYSMRASDSYSMTGHL